MVTCPPNVRPGQKIRFQLPIQLSQQQLETFKVNYDKDGWMRCLGQVRDHVYSILNCELLDVCIDECFSLLSRKAAVCF
jgi:hypothetical protein